MVPQSGHRHPHRRGSQVQAGAVHRILDILRNILPDGQGPVVLAEEGAGFAILLPRRHLVCVRLQSYPVVTLEVLELRTVTKIPAGGIFAAKKVCRAFFVV